MRELTINEFEEVSGGSWWNISDAQATTILGSACCLLSAVSFNTMAEAVGFAAVAAGSGGVILAVIGIGMIGVGIYQMCSGS